MESKEYLIKLEELVMKEIKKVADKGDISPTELENVKKAVCLLKEIKELNATYPASDVEQSGKRYAVVYGDPYHSQDSYGRTRSPITGRYINNVGYSGHSIEDRMIATLEQQMDAASSEYERQKILEEINHIRSGNR